ncbi:hypothetical protein [Psychrobacter lutiphocae]|uniref:hypothetical protein n=1 Tax=Psychrobacter lutiphocae TaxID=540500 RepID=UPI00036F9670|nr:hypothetical protein [Psychrobacter lutiphocae]
MKKAVIGVWGKHRVNTTREIQAKAAVMSVLLLSGLLALATSLPANANTKLNASANAKASAKTNAQSKAQANNQAKNQAKSERITPDCKSLNIMLMSLPNTMAINANWQAVGSNGKQAKTISMGDLIKNSAPDFSINCPSFNANYDGKTLTMKADSYQSIIDHLYKQLNRGIDLYNYRWYEDPNVKNEFQVNKYSFDLESLTVTDGYIKLPENAKLGAQQSYIPESAAISYKVNGGELKPLLQNRKIMAYHEAFKKAKSIDIYHKNPNMGSKGFGIQRIFIDKENGILEIYKSYNFPTNNS